MLLKGHRQDKPCLSSSKLSDVFGKTVWRKPPDIFERFHMNHFLEVDGRLLNAEYVERTIEVNGMRVLVERSRRRFMGSAPR